MRHPITDRDVATTITHVLQAVKRRNADKGGVAYVSSAEIIGLMVEEWDETRDASHANDHARLRAELLDMIVVGFVGIISIDSGTLEF